MMTTQLDLETWSASPLVTMAVDRAGPNYDAATLLTELHGIMTTLEERFPSLPFADILACHDPGSAADRQRIGLQLLDAGADPADVEQLVGSITGDEIGEPEFELAYADVPIKVLMANHGRSKTAAHHIRQVRAPITEIERRALAEYDRSPDVSKAEVCRRAGCVMATLRKAERKRRYQRWVERKESR